MTDKKTLYLVRHGKSTWDYENISDMDRPLKTRGIRNAYEMSTLLVNRKTRPDLIISSPAIRALHTAVIFAKELKCPFNKLKIEDIIYFSEEHSIVEFIKKTTNDISCMMLFGHNPVISNLSNIFLKNQVEYLPTCAVVELVFGIGSWLNINKNNIIIERIDRPLKS